MTDTTPRTGHISSVRTTHCSVCDCEQETDGDVCKHISYIECEVWNYVILFTIHSDNLIKGH